MCSPVPCVCLCRYNGTASFYVLIEKFLYSQFSVCIVVCLSVAGPVGDRRLRVICFSRRDRYVMVLLNSGWDFILRYLWLVSFSFTLDMTMVMSLLLLGMMLGRRVHCSKQLGREKIKLIIFWRAVRKHAMETSLLVLYVRH